jgi:hypothetical protein
MATRQTTLLLKRSNVIGKIPPLSGLTLGEIGLNTADAKLYTLFTSGTTGGTEVREIGWDKVSKTGDTITGDLYVNGSVSATTYQNLPISALTEGSNISITGSNGNYTISVTGATGGGGDNLPLSGGTVTGSTVFLSGLTANTIYTDYIDFNTGATVAQSVGRINWDSGTGTLNIAVGDADTGLIDLQVGQEEIVRVYNGEGTTLQKGEIVYVSGSQGNRPKVKRALATTDGYSVTTLGMVDLAIPSGSEGYVTTFGVISNLNTLGLSGGTPIWLSPTVAGGYTSTKPQAPDHTVLLGYVVRVDNTVGSIFVNISNGWELDELHDVRISGVTEGDLLVRSSYSGTPVWVNTKTLPGSYTITGNTNIGGNLTASGNTSLQGLTATTISATTYTNTPIEIQVAASDELTPITSGFAKTTFRTPCAMTVTGVRASLTTAQTSGNTFTVDINEDGNSILSTKLTIDNNQKTSTTATTPPVISDATLADDAEITVDVDQIGSGTATGLKITIIGKRI